MSVRHKGTAMPRNNKTCLETSHSHYRDVPSFMLVAYVYHILYILFGVPDTYVEPRYEDG